MRPSTLCGNPAFACPVSGSAVAGRISSSPASTEYGPRLQLTPTASTWPPANAAATSAARLPVIVSASSCTVTCAISGRAVAARTAATADCSSSSEVNVSSISRSTPRPSSSRAWSA